MRAYCAAYWISVGFRRTYFDRVSAIPCRVRFGKLALSACLCQWMRNKLAAACPDRIMLYAKVARHAQKAARRNLRHAHARGQSRPLARKMACRNRVHLRASKARDVRGKRCAENCSSRMRAEITAASCGQVRAKPAAQEACGFADRHQAANDAPMHA